MNERDIFVSQYRAALDMLRQAIHACPDARWHSPADHAKCWQLAYHALFYTHLYLQESEQTFKPWPGHRKEYRFELDAEPPAEPPSKAVVLDYLAFCQQEVVQRMADITLDGASGFYWLPFSKFQLQIDSIRHLQQHVGELMERLGAEAMQINWVGTHPVNQA